MAGEGVASQSPMPTVNAGSAAPAAPRAPEAVPRPGPEPEPEPEPGPEPEPEPEPETEPDLYPGAEPVEPALPPLFPEPSTPANRPPAPDNPAECPSVAPEDPWGPCIGLPVYLECNYGTYFCICDWIHWICVG